jgi:TetR/AcrR family transcriptional regulator, regulator of autoinduction and epiphytic fitness
MLAPADAHADGRLARGERARSAVVDALLDLLQAGELRPTAPRIAERAGVSLRSVFHHFADLEKLFATAAEHQMRRLRGLVGRLPVDGPLSGRLDAFVRQRARVLEAITPVRRAAVRVEPLSPELAHHLARVRAAGRAEVRRVFGRELDALPPAARRDAIDALTVAASWPTWEALRTHQGLAPARAAKVLHRMLAALLAA